MSKYRDTLLSNRRAYDGETLWCVQGLSTRDGHWHPLLHLLEQPAVFFNRRSCREWLSENRLALSGYGEGIFLKPLYSGFRIRQYKEFGK